MNSLALVLATYLAGCGRISFAITTDSSPNDDGVVADGLGVQHNIVFVSSGIYLAPWSPHSGPDGFCNTSAHTAGLLGNYVAWLSEPVAGNAADRLRTLPSARDWVRPDGQPFAATIDSIATGAIANPPTIDENVQDVLVADPAVNVATGTLANGTFAPGNSADCAAGTIEIGMPANAPAGAWTAAGFVPCSVSNLRLYCFGFGAP